MPGPLHAVAETPQFLRDVATAGLTDEEARSLVTAIATDPLQGVEIRGSGGVRKVRIAGRGKGKSGGYRVMTAFVGEDAPVYLLALLSKGDRGNFTDREVAAMRAMMIGLRRTWQDRGTWQERGRS